MSAVLNHVPVTNNRLGQVELDQPRIAAATRKTSTPVAAKSATRVLHVGFDWGTNKSCLKASFVGTQDLFLEEIISTVVGYAKEGIIDGLLPDNASVLFGNEALQHRLHLKLVQPMIDGMVKDLKAARDFAQHVRARIDVPEGTEIR